MDKIQIQVCLNDTNGNPADTKAKPHNTAMFWKKKKKQKQKAHQRKQHNYHISGQKESCGTANPTVFENPCAKTVESHIKEGNTARTKWITTMWWEATLDSSTRAMNFWKISAFNVNILGPEMPCYCIFWLKCINFFCHENVFYGLQLMNTTEDTEFRLDGMIL